MVSSLTKLQNKTILIIGGSAGIGHAVAALALESGSNVIIASSNQARISSAIAALKANYSSSTKNEDLKIRGIIVDLSNASTLETEIEALFQKAVEGTPEGKLDHVVFTAGDSLYRAPLSDISLDFMHRAGQVRWFGPLLVAKYIPRFVRSSHESSFTITTGAVGQKPTQDWSVMAAFAAGHYGMVKGLALELRPVRVNGVNPGAVDTELWAMGKEEKGALFDVLGPRMTTGRVGQAEDVAESFAACLKDWNMSGSVLCTNGGALVM